eukprot:gene10113-13591_t
MDIRNFFGSTQAKPKQISTSSTLNEEIKSAAKQINNIQTTTKTRTPPKNNKSKASSLIKDIDSFALEDSDDDATAMNKSSRLNCCLKAILGYLSAYELIYRKRLKSVKETDNRLTISDDNKISHKEIVAESIRDNSNCKISEIQVKESQKKNKSPTKQQQVKESAVAKIINDDIKSSLQSNDKKRKEVVTDVSTFFGDTSSSASAKPNISSTVVSSPHIDSLPEGTESTRAISPKKKPRVLSPPSKQTTSSTANKNDGSFANNQSNKLIFEGMRIAVTGVMSVKGRDEIENLIQVHGGKIATSISGKTSLLIAGTLLEDGRMVEEGNKYRTALEKKVKIFSEEEFLKKIDDIIIVAELTASNNAGIKNDQSNTSSNKISIPINDNNNNSGNYNNNNNINNVNRNSFNSSIIQHNPSSKSNKDMIRSHAVEDMMWVDKHKPKSTSEMIGYNEFVKKMSDWLRNWDNVHIKKTMKIPFNKDNPGAKSLLLSGPPGIGKTTLASLVAKECGFDLLEFNASDTRSKKSISEHLSDTVQSKAISFDRTDGTVTSKKRMIIMDEVDGMGGSDRGGIAELIAIIKTSKSPIVCICNDRQSPKIRSLANHCYDIKVRRPLKSQIATRLVVIAQRENMLIEPNAAELLVEQVGNDIRQSIHTMQMWKASSNHMNFTDIRTNMNRIEKDKILRQTPFDACQQILCGGGTGGNRVTLDDRYNGFFIDYSLMPLLVQQNYIEGAKNGYFKNNQIDEASKMDKLSRAADAVSDMVDQHWELLPTQAMFSVTVGSLLGGSGLFPQFPAWLGKNSSTTKKKRLTSEIVHHTSLSVGQGFGAVRLDYIPFLRKSLLANIIDTNNNSNNINNNNSSVDKIQSVIAMLDSYGLSKDDFMENMKELQFVVEGDKCVFVDNYVKIDTKTKTALTKTYNNTTHTSQLLDDNNSNDESDDEVIVKAMLKTATKSSASSAAGAAKKGTKVTTSKPAKETNKKQK